MDTPFVCVLLHHQLTMVNKTARLHTGAMTLCMVKIRHGVFASYVCPSGCLPCKPVTLCRFLLAGYCAFRSRFHELLILRENASGVARWQGLPPLFP